jgi:aldehyde dehydrogenase (NAD+)
MATVADIFATMDYGPAPEAAKPGLDWIAEHSPFKLFIGGEWREPSGGEYSTCTDPSSGITLVRFA